MSGVLDASALLAWLRNEDGADQVDEHLDGGVISAVNLSQVAQKISQHGGDGSRAATESLGMGLTLTPFAAEDALATAELWPHTREHGLSPGDRACLALARRLERPALTADRAWKTLDLDLEIHTSTHARLRTCTYPHAYPRTYGAQYRVPLPPLAQNQRTGVATTPAAKHPGGRGHETYSCSRSAQDVQFSVR